MGGFGDEAGDASLEPGAACGSSDISLLFIFRFGTGRVYVGTTVRGLGGDDGCA